MEIIVGFMQNSENNYGMTLMEMQGILQGSIWDKKRVCTCKLFFGIIISFLLFQLPQKIQKVFR